MRNEFDDIYNSVINGQHKQAFNQFVLLDLADIPDLIDYLNEELNQPEVFISLMKTYFNNKD